ncbi:MAG: copper-binding protein [Bryobacteraceae bacterium]
MTGLRWIALLMAMLSSCSKPPTPVVEYRLTGVVVELDTTHRTALIAHQEIKGWMEAMTMEFPVRNASDWKKLRPGLRIQAKVFHQPEDLKYWIADVEVATAAVPVK